MYEKYHFSYNTCVITCLIVIRMSITPRVMNEVDSVDMTTIYFIDCPITLPHVNPTPYPPPSNLYFPLQSRGVPNFSHACMSPIA